MSIDAGNNRQNETSDGAGPGLNQRVLLEWHEEIIINRDKPNSELSGQEFKRV